MTSFQLISRTLKHYLAGNLATAGGIAIATAVICGALIIGDSLKISLAQIVDQRLGGITHTITAGDRIFTQTLGEQTGDGNQVITAPVLKTEAVASIQGSNIRVNQLQVWGIDSLFSRATGASAHKLFANDNEVVINTALAGRLQVDSGDFILLRLKSIGPIPSNTPFVSETDQTITRRLKVSYIADRDDLGSFNLQTSQSASYNAFVSLHWLNRIMNLNGMANMVLVNATSDTRIDQLAEAMHRAWQAEDAGMRFDTASGNKGEALHLLSSERVFIDDYMSETIIQAFPEASTALTYFVNSIEFNASKTPYSFVTAIDSREKHDPSSMPKEITENGLWPIKPGQVVVNQWLADDLGVGAGDSLTMRYFEVGPLRELVEREHRFLVTGIIPMHLAAPDSILIPHLPGLSDAGSCRDWDAGIPIDLDAIRQQDEDYWDAFKGTPKAYISLAQGQSLWQNRFGNLTSIMIPNELYTRETMREVLGAHVDPTNLGFMINAVREQGLTAARGGVDFGQLFASLGIFIIISGLLLTWLLLSFSLKQRQEQIQLFVSLGFPDRLIQKILLWEAFFVSLAGVIIGLAFSVVYSKLVFAALNKNWYDIVRTDTLSLFFQPLTLATGIIISLLTGVAVVFWGIRKAIHEHAAGAKNAKNNKTIAPKPQGGSASAIKAGATRRRNMSFAVAILFIFAMAMITYLVVVSGYDRPLAWLIAGVLVLCSGIASVYIILFNRQAQPTSTLSLTVLSWKNMMRNPLRSFTIALLLALGSFVIVVTAANRKASITDDSDKSSGTGGFQFMAETTVPILRNLSLPESRIELGLPDNASFVQFLSTYDDDASCLNLNMVSNPRILAADPKQLQGRFSFVSYHPSLNRDDPWMSLNDVDDNIIPAIADQTVIQWGLGKKVGDTLTYMNARGKEIKLLLIGGLANSVFQGNVIISASNFLNHFPASGGSDVMLIEATDIDEGSFKEEMSLVFRDHGWEMTGTLDKMAAFNSVENTYLHIFFLMGAFGMLLGTIGLAVIMAKSMIERRAETALLRSLGYRMTHIIRLFFTEYATLFLAGMLIGIISALVATLPNFLSANQTISTEYLMRVVLILLANGIAWMLFIPYVMIKRLKLLEALRND
jgi:putative ABC transport system permease protein